MKTTEDSYFDSLWNQIKDLTLLHRYKAWNIYNLFMLCQKRFPYAGSAEFGVFRGGITVMLALLHSQKSSTVYQGAVDAYDSFQGLPESSEKDSGHYSKGHMIHSYEAFCNTLNKFDVAKRVMVHAGKFGQISFGISRPLNLVHIDCDLYKSTKDALQSIYFSVIPGGFIVFDDYFDQGGGVAAAVNEHISTTGEILFAGYGDQVIIVKGLVCRFPGYHLYNHRPPYDPVFYSSLGYSFFDGPKTYTTKDGITLDVSIPSNDLDYQHELASGSLTPELGNGTLSEILKRAAEKPKAISQRINNLVDYHAAILGRLP